MSALRSRPVLATVVFALGILLFEGWSWRHGRAELAGIPLPRDGAPANIEVELPFTPEAFNIQRLQQAGRLVRLEGRRAWLESVPRDQLVALARLYWIGRILPWHPQ